MACHQAGGVGIARAFPPLAASDFLNEDHKRAIDIVLHGMSGKIKVNNLEFNGDMPAMALSNDQIANVLTFLLNNWGNKGGTVTPQQVGDRREKGGPVGSGSGH